MGARRTYQGSQVVMRPGLRQHCKTQLCGSNRIMSIPAWQVITWRPVNARLDEWDQTIRRLRHLGTTVHVEPSADKLMSGQVLWGVMSGDKQLGMAWDWKEVRPNVVVMADPMTILSNLNFTLDDGVSIAEGERLVQLNNAIHDLPWQKKVRTLRQKWAVDLAARAKPASPERVSARA